MIPPIWSTTATQACIPSCWFSMSHCANTRWVRKLWMKEQNLDDAVFQVAFLPAFVSEPERRPEMAVRTNPDWDTELTAACRVSSVSTPTFRPLAFNPPIPVSTRLTTEGPIC
ncbi:hypothetical protein LX36DRAFT_319206 [Colletotrichum falcatum]|nr:hypothetical protein LX36DRAFT_319206 [Colletotrichum falcatum]